MRRNEGEEVERKVGEEVGWIKRVGGRVCTLRSSGRYIGRGISWETWVGVKPMQRILC